MPSDPMDREPKRVLSPGTYQVREYNHPLRVYEPNTGKLVKIVKNGETIQVLEGDYSYQGPNDTVPVQAVEGGVANLEYYFDHYDLSYMDIKRVERWT